MDKEKLRIIDIMKGIGIILMVLGHSGCSFYKYIYLFHMALFFMISGYLWNTKHANNLDSIKMYIKNKIRTLWIPYVIANLIFLLLTNVFMDLGIYTDKEDFQIYSGINDTLTEPLFLTSFFKRALGIVLFHGSTQMGGELWFFRCLFFVNIIHCIIIYIVNQMFDSHSIQNTILLFIFILAIVCTQLANRGDFDFMGGFKNQFAAYVVFLMGTQIKRLPESVRKKKDNKVLMYIIFIFSLSSLLVLNGYGTISLSEGYTTNCFFYIVCSIMGWLFTYTLASVLNNSVCISKILIVVRNHSVAIIVLHFISFKVVSFLYICLKDVSMVQLACFPVVHTGEDYLWFFYSLIGIVLPSVVDYLYKRTVRKIKANSIYIKYM